MSRENSGLPELLVTWEVEMVTHSNQFLADTSKVVEKDSHH
jgi:hypothetical protein